MGGNLLANVGEAVAMLLFGIGFANLLFQKNLIKKIIGFDIMDTAIYLFLAEKGYIAGRMPPIVVNGIQDVEAYINPIPSGLVLTGIGFRFRQRPDAVSDDPPVQAVSHPGPG